VPNWARATHDFATNLLSALLPQTCFVCGGPAGARAVCADCFAEFPALPEDRCPVCAIASPQGQICGACLKKPPLFAATQALYPYEFPIRELIHGLKFDADFSVPRVFAAALREAAKRCVADCVVPVPVHAKRLAERGFNQALLLAQPVAESLGVPLFRDALVKDRLSPAQAGLAREERLRNLQGAFRARRSFAGMRVLVVDDVMTSGATLSEMALALRAAGAVRIENLVVARTAAA
jgi:ComF family protein